MGDAVRTGWRELREGMIWPRLLAAPGLALRPARLGLSVLCVALIALIGRMPMLWLKEGKGPLALLEREGGEAGAVMVTGVTELSLAAAIGGLIRLMVDVPGRVLNEYPWSSGAILVPMLLVWCVLGGAMARSAAEEHALRQYHAWPRALGFALGRWWSLSAGLLGPLAIAGVVALALSGAGWLLLGHSAVSVVGAVVFGVALLAGAGAVLLLGICMFGGAMIVPAAACEGTGGVDAFQRCGAYMLAKPLVFAGYVLIGVVIGVLSTLALSSVMSAIVGFAGWGTTRFLDPALAEAIVGALHGKERALNSVLSASAHGVLSFWGDIPRLLVTAFAVSYVHSVGTVMYLCMRQACDGQDPEELWEPGLPGGVSEVRAGEARLDEDGDERDDE